MTGQSPTQIPDASLSRLQGYQKALDSISVDPVDPGSVISAIGSALAAINGSLAVPAPKGSPAAIGAKAAAYDDAASTLVSKVGDILQNVSDSALPAAWRGGVAETAGQVVSALDVQAQEASSGLPQGAGYLREWAQALQAAQPLDSDGRAALESARSRLESVRSAFEQHPSSILGWAEKIADAVVFPIDMGRTVAAAGDVNGAVRQAQDGVGQMVSAAVKVCDAAADWQTLSLACPNANTNQDPNPTVPSAPGLKAVDLEALADVDEKGLTPSVPGPPLLGGNLSQALTALDKLPPAQRTEFNSLLTTVKSPQKAANLLYLLANGWTVSQLKQQVATGQIAND